MSQGYSLPAALLLLAAATSASPAQTRPNIIVILADDLGWADVGSFDPKRRGFYQTPNIDALASQGMRFTQAYTNGANCAPTRAALLSGQYYPRQPIYHVGTSGRGKMIPAPNATDLPLEKVTIAEALKRGGYASGFIGKWHIGSPGSTGPVEQGFDLNVGGYLAGNPGAWEGGYFRPNNNPFIDDAAEGEYLTDYLTRKAVAFVERHRAGPFYLQLSYYTPHTPLQAPEDRRRKYLEKAPRGGHHDATYAAMIESLDRGVGEIMAVLDRLRLADRTLVVFLSDNGGSGGYHDLGREDNGITDNSPLKAGKGSFYEGGIRVPLIVRWPGVVPPGTESAEPVIGIDLYPTLLDAAGLEAPSGYVLDGVSLMPLLRDPGAWLGARNLYWHFPGYPNSPWRTSPVSVVRSDRWKLMKFYEDGRVELYDLEEDIGEQRNLAGDRPMERQRLQRDLERWLEMHDAPMPRHPATAAAGLRCPRGSAAFPQRLPGRA